MNPITEVRAHLTAALTGVATVGSEYGALPSGPLLLLRLSSFAPVTYDHATVGVDVDCVVPAAGGGLAVDVLDQLMCDTVGALQQANIRVGTVNGYHLDQDTSTLTASIPTETVWKES